MGARVTPEGRYALRNNALAIHRKNSTEKRMLTDAAALRACLEDDLQIRIPEAPEVEAMLDRISRTPVESNS
jgi:arylamine N-acetyltransferase